MICDKCGRDVKALFKKPKTTLWLCENCRHIKEKTKVQFD